MQSVHFSSEPVRLVVEGSIAPIDHVACQALRDGLPCHTKTHCSTLDTSMDGSPPREEREQ